jgi:hypothetical protein
MESPSTWNATQKLINNALYKKTAKTPARNQRAKSVVDALKVAKLMKKEADGLENTIKLVLDGVEETAAKGMCGSSSVMHVYNKLKELGVIE